MLERGFELLANLPELSSCLLVLQGYGQGTGEYFCLRGRTQTHNTQLFFTTFRVPYAVLSDGGEQFWCFLLADLSVVPPSKGAMLVDAWSVNMIPPILHGG